MSFRYSQTPMENPPEPDRPAALDRIPVLTEPVPTTSGAADRSDLDALTDRVLDEIAPALRAAIATACEDYLAAREARSD